MKPVLILQHQPSEHAAYLITWLMKHRVSFAVSYGYSETGFPSSMTDYSALAVLGGGMSANDDLESNRRAENLISEAVADNKPVIGHCLGGQLMTRALGGTVIRAAVPEIGWQPIAYQDHDLTMTWFGTDPAPVVAQWHYDTFSVPPGATLLAWSSVCANQAWTLGPHLAMQFHIELDEHKAREWAQDPDPDWSWALNNFDSVQNSQDIVAGIPQHLPQHQRMADQIYTQWLNTTCWAVANKY